MVWIKLSKKEALGLACAVSVLEIDHIILNTPRVCRWNAVNVRVKKCRRFCAQGYYFIKMKSSSFFLAVKPWRMFALQHHRNFIEVHTSNIVDGLHRARNVTDRPFCVLEKLVRDEQLASLIGSLSYLSEPIEFHVLYDIVKRLRNIKHIHVYLAEYDTSSITTEQICEVLNELPRVCSVQIKRTEKMGLELGVGPYMLFNNVRHGIFELHMAETPTITGAIFAYKSLRIHFQQSELETDTFSRLTHSVDEEWTRFVQLCTSLVHLTLEQYDSRFSGLKLLTPVNLNSLSLTANTNARIPLTDGPLVLLKKLTLRGGRFDWAELVVWCPLINYLQLDHVSIIHCICGSRLQLTRLKYMGSLFSDNYLDHDRYNGLVRQMCLNTPQRLAVKVGSRLNVRGLVKELCDWMAHPELLVGTVVCLVGVRPIVYDQLVKSKKRVILLAKSAVLKLARFDDDLRFGYVGNHL